MNPNEKNKNYREDQNQRTSSSSAPRRRPKDKDLASGIMSALPFIIALPLSLIFLEVVTHLILFSEMTASFFAYTVFFSISGGMLLALLCTIFSKKINYVINLVLIGAASVLCCIQVVYSSFFPGFFSLFALGNAGNLADYMRNTILTVLANLHWIILIFVPFILFAVFGRNVLAAQKMSWILRGACAVFSVCFLLLGSAYVNTRDGIEGDKFAYREGFWVNDAIGRFGVLTTARLEIQYKLFGNEVEELPEDTDILGNGTTTAIRGEDIFGTKDPVTTNPPVTDSPIGTEPPPQTGENTSGGTHETNPPTTEPTPPPVVEIDRSPQRMDIDFDALIAEATKNGQSSIAKTLKFLKSRAGTNKNEFTGLFEGKNLIFITVEAWAPAAINEKLTPTLYKMKNEGFVFDNYYCGIWYGSTATGEYSNITGNFYYSDVCIENSSKTYQPFALGNMLGKEGYTCSAFHNHSYDFYRRDLSHPNFGYDWYAIGNYWTKGVDFTDAWPTSDHELALNSLKFISADKPFHLYYMTTSGHCFETFLGNKMSAKHKNHIMSVLGNDYKNELSLSYIASQYEVELMVKELYDQCEKLGILEDTVFVMAPDHFPYSLSENESANIKTLAELYGLPEKDIHKNYELYRAPLIIWSGSMKQPVKVDKVCSSIDILPTVLNLFGLEYDSRIIAGQDILDLGTEGIVPLCMLNPTDAHNFITDYGFFNIKTKKFHLFEGYSINDENMLKSYLDPKRDYMYNMRIQIPKILDLDIYGFIFK